jgi:hypothetical protein
MQINLKLDCTLYSGLGVHFHRNTQLTIPLVELNLTGVRWFSGHRKPVSLRHLIY